MTSKIETYMDNYYGKGPEAIQIHMRSEVAIPQQGIQPGDWICEGVPPHITQKVFEVHERNKVLYLATSLGRIAKRELAMGATLTGGVLFGGLLAKGGVELVGGHPISFFATLIFADTIFKTATACKNIYKNWNTEGAQNLVQFAPAVDSFKRTLSGVCCIPLLSLTGFYGVKNPLYARDLCYEIKTYWRGASSIIEFFDLQHLGYWEDTVLGEVKFIKVTEKKDQ